MTPQEVFRQRLAQQQLSQTPFLEPSEVVAWLGAIQAQDYLGSKWALGLRMRQGTDAQIEQAFNNGAILRTHVMRPTWHFVTPADIRWLLALTAPRVKAANAPAVRRLELDDALFGLCNELIAKTLQGGQARTRAELSSILATAGIVGDSLRTGHILMRAEIDGVICSGPRRGKQLTYALLDERAPNARRLERDEALAELTRRYFTGHGPATIRDFVWWSGLTVADAKAGLDMVASDLEHSTLHDQTYYFSANDPPTAKRSQDAYLLPTYDEFLVGYAGFDKARQGGQDRQRKIAFESRLVTEDKIAGSWRRTIKKEMALLEIAPFAPLTAREQAAIARAAQRYEEFIGLPVSLSIV